MSTLHITNGDSTVDLLEAAGVEGDYLPWRDVLHLGPVPMRASLDALSAVRATFIAGMGWGDVDTVLSQFRQRDTQLKRVNEYDTVMLWFEHDLYDQLQILQVLDTLAERAPHHADLTLINPGMHLGYHTPSQALALLETRKPVSQQQFALAKTAWKAFCQGTPHQWADLLQYDTSALPYLHNAVLRGCEELPDSRSGLTKTESLMLALIAEGQVERGPLFRAYCQREPDQFHGDSSFFWLLDQLLEDPPVLLTESATGLALSDSGQKVNIGSQRWQRRYSQDHWFGGYQINAAPHWYWNATEGKLTDL